MIYEAYNNEVPVISGGIPVTGWTQVSGNIYSAPLSRSTKLRSLFVNGVRATMTKSGPVQGYGNESVFTIPSNASYSIGGATGSFPDDVQFSEPAVGFYANPADIELVQGYTFNASIYTVRGIANVGGNPDFQLQQPYGAIGANVPLGGLQPSGAFEIQNAYELLNTPGQFYFNRTTQTLYYYSRGENMATAQVIAPTTEGLIQIHGASNTDRVTNLQFIGITFAYDHWQMYNVAGSYGMVALQSTAGEVKFAGSQVWAGDLWNDTEVPQASVERPERQRRGLPGRHLRASFQRNRPRVYRRCRQFHHPRQRFRGSLRKLRQCRQSAKRLPQHQPALSPRPLGRLHQQHGSGQSHPLPEPALLPV